MPRGGSDGRMPWGVMVGHSASGFPQTAAGCRALHEGQRLQQGDVQPPGTRYGTAAPGEHSEPQRGHAAGGAVWGPAPGHPLGGLGEALASPKIIPPGPALLSSSK